MISEVLIPPCLFTALQPPTLRNSPYSGPAQGPSPASAGRGSQRSIVAGFACRSGVFRLCLARKPPSKHYFFWGLKTFTAVCKSSELSSAGFRVPRKPGKGPELGRSRGRRGASTVAQGGRGSGERRCRCSPETPRSLPEVETETPPR